MNASLATILIHGLKPVKMQSLHGREYFEFRNGQIRRQIGHGHSREERIGRCLARRQLRNQVDLSRDRSRQARLDRPALLVGPVLAARYRPSAS